MHNEADKTPIHGLELFSEIERFQVALRGETVGLPPSPAKEMIEFAFAALTPLLASLARDYPVMIDAFHKQRDLIEADIEKAKQNLGKARENIAKVPSVEQIQKNITPTAPTLPIGLATVFADEMKNRYVPKPMVDLSVQRDAAAWQDWTIAR